MASSSHNADISKRRFLTPRDLEEIEACVSAVPKIGSPDFIVPGSLGAPVVDGDDAVAACLRG